MWKTINIWGLLIGKPYIKFYLVYLLFNISSYILYYVDWLIGMLLVSRFAFVEEDAVQVFRYYGFHMSSSFLM